MIHNSDLILFRSAIIFCVKLFRRNFHQLTSESAVDAKPERNVTKLSVRYID